MFLYARTEKSAADRLFLNIFSAFGKCEPCYAGAAPKDTNQNISSVRKTTAADEAATTRRLRPKYASTSATAAPAIADHIFPVEKMMAGKVIAERTV